MKNTVRLVFAVAIFALCSNVSAQKMAYINMNELIFSMPEIDSVQIKMQKIVQGAEDELESLNVELNRKFDEYTKNQANWTDLVKQSKSQDIQRMQTNIQEFQQMAQESIQQEQQKLMQPVQEKATKAIEAVAKEQKIEGVIDSQVLYFKAVSMVDLLPAVKAHLGIKN